METKSRYEVIAELEEKKRKLIHERESFPERIRAGQREIRDLKRDIEDKEEELKEFKEEVEQRKQTINELIKSVDDSLSRFAELNKTKA